MKILHYGDCSHGAIGIISRDIKGIIDTKYPEIQFDLLNWSVLEDAQTFFQRSIWKNYDILIVDPHLAQVVTDWEIPGCQSPLIKSEDLVLFKSKLIPVYHHEVDVPADHFRHGWYEGWFTTPVCGINPYIVNQIKERGAESKMLPIGVNTDKFKPYKKVNKIKRAGFVGESPLEDWNYIKRPELFQEICKKAGIEPVIITGRDHGPEMYEDIDAIICTSMAEGLPTYFAEVAACKIPFISTNVGIVREYNKVKKFNTVDEAVDIINQLNESEDNIKEYVDSLYDEMFPDRNWENILEDYWIPYFKELANKRMYDKIYCINLEKRTDRWEEFQRDVIEGLRLDKDKFERISAIDTTSLGYHASGAIGCSLSHLKIWKDMIENKYESALVFEDDFQPKVSADVFNTTISTLYSIHPEFSVCCLGWNGGLKTVFFDRGSGFSFANDISTTSCYIITLEYAKLMYDSVSAGVINMLIHNQQVQIPHLIDKIWCKFQNHDWLVSSPKMGIQRAGHSDIQDRFTNYNC